MRFLEKFRKSVSIGLVVTFVVTQNTPVTFAQVTQALLNTSDRPLLPQQIPVEFGRIQTSHPGTNGKSVILIQDAHGSLPVQKNIRSLISFLNQEYGINLLLLEGAAQKLEPDLYRFYEEAEPSRLVGERLLERGELTGAEMFLLDQAIDKNCGRAKFGEKQKPECAEGQGAESAEAYARDLTLFREIISRDHELTAAMEKLSLLFQKKAGSILKPELLQFLKSVDQAETAQQALPETLQKIGVQAQSTLQLDLLNPRHQFEYPMLVRYFKLKEMEGKIQPESAKTESQRLVQWLEANKAPQNLVQQIRELSPETSQMRSVLEELVREMQSKGFDFKDYPEWTRWAGMNALMQEVEPSALMKEMEDLTWKIVSKLAPTPEEKAMLTLYRKTFYLRKLLTLSLSSEDWDKVNSRRNELVPSKLQGELGGVKTDTNLDKAFSKAVEFYETAKEREIYFVENLQKQMQAKNQNHAVLVAGGFHQEGVLEKLKTAGYGYVSVMPNAGGFDLKESKKTYRRSMLETSQVQHFLRMVDRDKTPKPMVNHSNLHSRVEEIEKAKNGVHGTERSGTALDHPNRSHTPGVWDGEVALVRSESRAPYTAPKNFKEGIERFYAYKLEMLDALNQEDAEENKKYAEEFLGALGDFYRVVDFLGAQIKKSKKRDLLSADALAVGNQLAISGYPQELFVHEKAEDILREIEALSVGDGDAEYQALKETIILDLAQQLYPKSKDDRDRVVEVLLNDVLTTDVQNILPSSAFVGDMAEWKDKARSTLFSLSSIARSWGHYNLVFRNIRVNPNPRPMTSVGAQSDKDRELILRSTIKHEAIHYLSERGDFKFPVDGELLTWLFDVVERFLNMPEGATLQDYFQEFGEEHIQEIFELGQQLGQKGEMVLRTHALMSSRAEYFDKESLYNRVRSIYLNHEQPLPSNEYSLDRAAGILLAGWFLNYPLTKEAPMETARIFFEVLHGLYAPQTPEIMAGVEKNRAQFEIGFIRGNVPRANILPAVHWGYQKTPSEQFAYAPVDFLPSSEDLAEGMSVTDALQLAYRRALGWGTLTLEFAVVSQSYLPAEVKEHSAYSPFWETLNLGRITRSYYAYPDTTFLGLRKDRVSAEMQPQAEWIYAALSHRYNPERMLLLSRSQVESLPLHLQYLDSLRYVFTNYDNQSLIEDPRVTDPEVIKVLGEIEWVEAMTHLSGTSVQQDKRLNEIAGKIWDGYRRLYDLAVERLKQELMERMLDQKFKAEQVQSAFQQLPEEDQQAIQEFIQQMMQQQAQQFSSGDQPQNQSMQQGQQGQAGQQGQQSVGQQSGGQQSAQSSVSVPGAGATGSGQSGSENQGGSQSSGTAQGNQGQGGSSSLTGKLSALKDQMAGLQTAIGELAQNAKAVKEKLPGMQEQAATNAGAAGSQQKGPPAQSAPNKMSQMAQAIKDAAEKAAQEGKDIHSQADAANQEAQAIHDKMPWQNPQAPTENLLNQAGALQEQANELLEMAQMLQEQAKKMDGLNAQANSEAKVLQDAASEINQMAQAMKQGAEKIIHGQGEAQTTLNEAEAAAKKAEKAVNQAQAILKKLADSKSDISSSSSSSSSQGGESASASSVGDKSSSTGSALKGFSAPITGTPPADFSLKALHQSGTSSASSKPSGSALLGKGMSVDIPDSALNPTLDYKKLEPDEEAWYLAQFDRKVQWNEETVTARDMIDDLVKVLDVLLEPSANLRRQAVRGGKFLGGVVPAVTGQFGGWVNPELKDIPKIYLAWLVDASGSMGSMLAGLSKTEIAQLTAFVLLEAFFEHNKKRKQKGLKDLWLEIGKFEDDTSLLMGHEQFKNMDELEKPYFIYHVLQAFTAGGGTNYSTAAVSYLGHIMSQRLPKQAIKLVAMLTDEEVDQSQLDVVQGVQITAAAAGIHSDVVPMGDKHEVTASIEAHGVENVVDTRELNDNPALLAPLLLARALGYVMDQGHDLHLPPHFKALVNSMRSEARMDPYAVDRKKLMGIDGYDFFKTYRDDEGREFLVYDYAGEMTLWQKAPGGPEVPKLEKAPAMTQANELQIYKWLNKISKPNVIYRFVDASNRYFIREAENQSIELFSRDHPQSLFSSKAKWPSHPTLQREEENYFGANAIRWKFVEGGAQAQIQLQNGESLNIDLSEEIRDPSLLYFEQPDSAKNQILMYFGGDEPVVQVWNKSEKNWVREANMKLERLNEADKPSDIVTNITGMPSVGKGALPREMARLMNLEYLKLAGHLRMDAVELVENEELRSGRSFKSPSALEQGKDIRFALMVLDEGNKVPEKTIESMQSRMTSGQHEIEYVEGGVHKRASVPNNPMSRFVFASNIPVPGIEGQAFEGLSEAMLSRILNEAVIWQTPDEEAERVLKHARKYADRQGRPLPGTLQKTIGALMGVVTSLRLNYLSDDVALKRKISTKNPTTGFYENWESGIKDLLMQLSKPGKTTYLLREPSPRIVQRIIEHFILFPKDWQYRAHEVVFDIYSFEAEVDPGNRSRQVVETAFQAMNLTTSNAWPVLDSEKSFALLERDGNFDLVVTPVSATGQVDDAWDAVAIPVSVESQVVREFKRTAKISLPENFKNKLRYPQNHLAFYKLMQDRAKGEDSIQVGPPSTGKTEMAKDFAELCNGSSQYYISSYEGMTLELLYKQMLGARTPFETSYELGLLLEAMRLGKVIVLDESNKAGTEILGLLNEISEKREFSLPDGTVVRAAHGFQVIHAINPGADVSREFWERSSIHRVGRLPLDSAMQRVARAGDLGNKQINSKLLGVEAYQQKGAKTGLLAFLSWTQQMADQGRAGGRAKQPEMVLRTMIYIIEQLARQFSSGPEILALNRHWIAEAAEWGVFGQGRDVKKQPVTKAEFITVLQKIRRGDFKSWETEVASLSGDKRSDYTKQHLKTPQVMLRQAIQEAYAAPNKISDVALEKALKEMSLWTDAWNEDAVMKLLDEEDVMLEMLPMLENGTPHFDQTLIQDHELQQILIYLQRNVSGDSLDAKITILNERIADLHVTAENPAQAVQSWQDLPFEYDKDEKTQIGKLRRFAKLAEIYRVLNLIIEKRGHGKAGRVHSQQTTQKLSVLKENIEIAIQARLWPEYVLKRAEDPIFDVPAELAKWLEINEKKKQAVADMSTASLKEPAMLMHVFVGEHKNDEGPLQYCENVIKPAFQKRSEQRDLPEISQVVISGVSGAVSSGVDSFIAEKNAFRSEARTSQAVQSLIDQAIAQRNDLEKEKASLERDLKALGEFAEMLMGESIERLKEIDSKLMPELESQIEDLEKELVAALAVEGGQGYNARWELAKVLREIEDKKKLIAEKEKARELLKNTFPINQVEISGYDAAITDLQAELNKLYKRYDKLIELIAIQEKLTSQQVQSPLDELRAEIAAKENKLATLSKGLKFELKQSSPLSARQYLSDNFDFSSTKIADIENMISFEKKDAFIYGHVEILLEHGRKALIFYGTAAQAKVAIFDAQGRLEANEEKFKPTIREYAKSIHKLLSAVFVEIIADGDNDPGFLSKEDIRSHTEVDLESGEKIVTFYGADGRSQEIVFDAQGRIEEADGKGVRQLQKLITALQAEIETLKKIIAEQELSAAQEIQPKILVAGEEINIPSVTGNGFEDDGAIAQVFKSLELATGEDYENLKQLMSNTHGEHAIFGTIWIELGAGERLLLSYGEWTKVGGYLFKNGKLASVLGEGDAMTQKLPSTANNFIKAMKAKHSGHTIYGASWIELGGGERLLLSYGSDGIIGKYLFKNGKLENLLSRWLPKNKQVDNLIQLMNNSHDKNVVLGTRWIELAGGERLLLSYGEGGKVGGYLFKDGELGPVQGKGTKMKQELPAEAVKLIHLMQSEHLLSKIGGTVWIDLEGEERLLLSYGKRGSVSHVGGYLFKNGQLSNVSGGGLTITQTLSENASQVIRWIQDGTDKDGFIESTIWLELEGQRRLLLTFLNRGGARGIKGYLFKDGKLEGVHFDGDKMTEALPEDVLKLIQSMDKDNLFATVHGGRWIELAGGQNLILLYGLNTIAGYAGVPAAPENLLKPVRSSQIPTVAFEAAVKGINFGEIDFLEQAGPSMVMGVKKADGKKVLQGINDQGGVIRGPEYEGIEDLQVHGDMVLLQGTIDGAKKFMLWDGKQFIDGPESAEVFKVRMIGDKLLLGIDFANGQKRVSGLLLFSDGSFAEKRYPGYILPMVNSVPGVKLAVELNGNHWTEVTKSGHSQFATIMDDKVIFHPFPAGMNFNGLIGVFDDKILFSYDSERAIGAFDGEKFYTQGELGFSPHHFLSGAELLGDKLWVRSESEGGSAILVLKGKDVIKQFAYSSIKGVHQLGDQILSYGEFSMGPFKNTKKFMKFDGKDFVYGGLEYEDVVGVKMAGDKLLVYGKFDGKFKVKIFDKGKLLDEELEYESIDGEIEVLGDKFLFRGTFSGKKKFMMFDKGKFADIALDYDSIEGTYTVNGKFLVLGIFDGKKKVMIYDGKNWITAAEDESLKAGTSFVPDLRRGKVNIKFGDKTLEVKFYPNGLGYWSLKEKDGTTRSQWFGEIVSPDGAFALASDELGLLTAQADEAQIQRLKDRAKKLIDWLEWTQVAATSAVAGIAAQIVALVEEWLEIDKQLASHEPRATSHELKSAAAPKKQVMPMPDGDLNIGFMNDGGGGVTLTYHLHAFHLNVSEADQTETERFFDFRREDVLQAKIKDDVLYVVVKNGVDFSAWKKTSTSTTAIGNRSPNRAVFLTQEDALKDPQYKGLFELEPIPTSVAKYPLKEMTNKTNPSTITLQPGGFAQDSTSIIRLNQISSVVLFQVKGPAGILKEQTQFDDFKFSEIVSAKQPVGTNEIYIVVEDSVDTTSLPEQSGVGGYKFIWIKQSDAESAAGYAQYKDVLEYETASFDPKAFFDSLNAPWVGDDGKKYFHFNGKKYAAFVSFNAQDDSWVIDTKNGLSIKGSTGVDATVLITGPNSTYLYDNHVLIDVKWEPNNSQLVFVFDESKKKEILKLLKSENKKVGKDSVGYRIEFVTPTTAGVAPVKLIPHPWLAQPTNTYTLGEYPVADAKIEVELLMKMGNKLLVKHVNNFRSKDPHLWHEIVVDKDDIVTIGWDGVIKSSVVVLKDSVALSKYPPANWHFRFVSESYALAHQDEFKDILSYTATSSTSQFLKPRTLFFDSLKSPLWEEDENRTQNGQFTKMMTQATLESSYFASDASWHLYMYGSRGKLTVSVHPEGARTIIHHPPMDISGKIEIQALDAIVDIAFDESEKMVHFKFNKKYEAEIRKVFLNFLSVPPVSANGDWGYRIEFVTPTTPHPRGVEGLKERREELGKKIDALKEKALAIQKIEVELAEKEALLKKEELKAGVSASGGMTGVSYEQLSLAAALDAGDKVESVMTLNGKRVLLSTDGDGKGLKVKVWRNNQWELVFEDSQDSFPKWEKVGDNLLLRLQGESNKQSQVLLFDGDDMKKIFDYGAEYFLKWKTIGDKILIGYHNNLKQTQQFHYWDGATLSSIGWGSLPRYVLDWDWKIEGDQALLKITQTDSNSSQFFKWKPENPAEGFVKLTERFSGVDKNWPVFDGKILIADEKNIRVVDIESGKELGTVPGKLVTLNVNGKQALIASQENNVLSLNEWTGSEFKDIPVQLLADEKLHDIYFVDKKFLVSFLRNGKVLLKQLQDDKSLKVVGTFSNLGDLSLKPVLVNGSLLVPLQQRADGTYILTRLEGDGLVNIFDAPKLVAKSSLTPLGKDQAVAQIFYSDGTTQFLIWDGEKIHPSDVFMEAVSEVIDGKLFIYGKQQGESNFKLVIWDGEKFDPQDADVAERWVDLKSLHGHLFRLSGLGSMDPPQIAFWNGTSFQELIPAGQVYLQVIKSLVGDADKLGIELNYMDLSAGDPSIRAFSDGIAAGYDQKAYFLDQKQLPSAGLVVDPVLVSKLQIEIAELKAKIAAYQKSIEEDSGLGDASAGAPFRLKTEEWGKDDGVIIYKTTRSRITVSHNGTEFRIDTESIGSQSGTFFLNVPKDDLLQIKYLSGQTTLLGGRVIEMDDLIVVALKKGTSKKPGYPNKLGNTAIQYLTEDEILANYEKWKNIFEFEERMTDSELNRVLLGFSGLPFLQELKEGSPWILKNFGPTKNGWSASVGLERGGSDIWRVRVDSPEGELALLAAKQSLLDLGIIINDVEVSLINTYHDEFVSTGKEEIPISVAVNWDPKKNQMILILPEVIQGELVKALNGIIDMPAEKDGIGWRLEFSPLLDPQGYAGELSVEVKARSELRASKPDAPSQEAAVHRSEKREGTLPMEVIDVAIDATEYVFASEVVTRVELRVKELLRKINPGWFAGEKQVLDIQSFLTAPGILKDKLIIGRVYDELPSEDSYEYEFLKVFLAQNPLAEFVFSSAAERREAGQQFARKLQKDVNQIMTKLGETGVSAKIIWKDEPVNVAAYVAEQSKETSEVPKLLFSDQNGLDFGSLDHVLLVQNDQTDEEATLFGLVASLHELFKPQKKTGFWVMASELIKQFSLQAKVAQAFAKSA